MTAAAAARTHRKTPTAQCQDAYIVSAYTGRHTAEYALPSNGAQCVLMSSPAAATVTRAWPSCCIRGTAARSHTDL
jgi:hypothetical protein